MENISERSGQYTDRVGRNPYKKGPGPIVSIEWLQQARLVSKKLFGTRSKLVYTQLSGFREKKKGL